MSNFFECKESDWRLFRKYIPIWQENYMARLNKEYVALLTSDRNPSSNFWDVEKRINKDKKHPGVCINMRRSEMITNIVIMIRDGVITMEDLKDFSEELRKTVVLFLGESYGTEGEC